MVYIMHNGAQKVNVLFEKHLPLFAQAKASPKGEGDRVSGGRGFVCANDIIPTAGASHPPYDIPIKFAQTESLYL